MPVAVIVALLFVSLVVVAFYLLGRPRRRSRSVVIRRARR